MNSISHSVLAGELSVAQLQTLVSVVEHGGYAAAARDQGVSSPTLWQQIQSLERLYGESLFVRSGRGVKPTPFARQLYEEVAVVLAALNSTFEIKSRHQRRDQLRLVTGVRMLMEDLATPLANFQARGDCHLVIHHGNNRTAEEMLLADEADLGLTLEAGQDRESRQIHYEPAYFVDFLAIAPGTHPFSAARACSLRELVKHKLIVTLPGTHGRDALDHAMHRQRLTPNIAVETDNSGFTISCVQAGMGVGILAGHADGMLCRALTARSLRKQLGRRQIVVMWKKGRTLTNNMRELIAEVKQRSS